MIFPRISPAVIVAVTDGDRLLLSKYAGRAYTRYALLAGYAEIGETIEQTVHREVMEEVGLKVKNLRYYKSQPWGVDGNVLMGFFCDVDGNDTIHIDETELSMAGWYERDALPARDDGISLTREMIRIFEEGNEPK
jgi:NAD+ diphosphatase